jgi:hypothetical protein
LGFEAISKVKMVCGSCGSEKVLRDAWAEWDIESQEWVLQNVFDYAFCEACDSETAVEEIE